MSVACNGCGEPCRLASPIGWFCVNDACTYERDQARLMVRQSIDRRERETYERLKAKFEGPGHEQ